MLKSFGNQRQQVQRLASGDDTSWWGKGLSSGSLVLLRSIVTPELTDADAAALQWYVRNVMFFELQLAQDPDVRLIKYEHLVAEPAKTLNHLLDFVELPVTGKMEKFIFSGSIGKQAAPNFSPEVEQLCLSLLKRLDSSGALISS